MKKLRHYRQLWLTALCSVMLVFAALVPAYAAADLTGKTITKVSVTGNSQVAESDILAAVKVKPGSVLTAEAVKQDMQAVYELGYFFDVATNFAEVPEGVEVTYAVAENPVLKEVVFSGNTKATNAQLSGRLKVTPGKILNTKTLNENARGIEEYYRQQGYILAKVSDVSMEQDGVLKITINEGMLEGIEVKGNDKTKSYVVTRELKMKVGEPFNAKQARRGMQRVYNLGFFEDVNMKLNPGKEPNAVVLQADVVEQKTGTFTIGGGYSSNDGLIGIIELGDNNFRGTGDKAKIHWEFGGSSDDGVNTHNYEFSYTKPWLDAKETSLSFSIYNYVNKYSDYEGGSFHSQYYRQRKGFEVTLGRPQNDYTRNYITLKNRNDKYLKYVSGVDDPANNANYLTDNFGLTRSVTLTRTFDSRDNIFNPTEGTYYSTSAEFAGRMFGGDFNYNKFSGETRKYFDRGKDHIIAVRANIGYATGSMPDSAKFAVGGSDTLRGYQDDEFKGNKMLSASVEYRIPVAKKVQGVIFTDIGNAWDGTGFGLAGLKKSVGLGVRVTTPLGPVRLDFAKGSEGARTHFSFGGQF